MMHLSYLWLLLKRVAVLVILYTLLRIIFFLFNHNEFPDLTFSEGLSVFLKGIRFDVVAITICSAPLIFLHLLPFRFREYKAYRILLSVIFVFSMAIMIIPNIVDFILYHYALKRFTADIIFTIGVGNDFTAQIPNYFVDFWCVPLFWLSFIAITIIVDKIIRKKKISTPENTGFIKYTLIHTGILIIAGLFAITGMRGGLQYRPLGIINAGFYTEPQNVPLLLNSTFTVIKTLDKQQLSETPYMPEKDAVKIFNPRKNFSVVYKDSTFKKFNVAVIILESFSKEYIGFLNKSADPKKKYKSYTPFLDSLLSESYVFPNAYASCRKSMDAIPAVLASVPDIMTNSYIISAYSGNKINSVASLLKKKGYSSAFYHGGTNGTMGFDSFVRMAGYDKYYGKNEYKNQKDFDGAWGIYDGPYFKYFAQELNTSKKPFCNAIFSLSSHHPYLIPPELKGKFDKGTLEIHESIGYTDFALRQFFNEAKNKSWFDSTLFVITADHCAIASDKFYINRVGMYCIPVCFYQHNSKLKGIDSTIVQQTDIMPSILAYLNFNEDFIAYGENAFDKNKMHFNINYSDGLYQVIAENYVLLFDGKRSVALYDLKNDRMMKDNLLEKNTKKAEHLERFIKSVIQQYNHAMLTNKLAL